MHESPQRSSEILQLLNGADPQASSQILPLVYDELRELARRRMAREPAGHTLQATALVHEAYLRVRGDGDARWDGRGHFFAAAAEAMRRILVEAARRRKSGKRGGGWERITLSGLVGDDERVSDQLLLDLDDALRELEKKDPVRSDVVKLRYFAGLTVEQAAETLGISPATVKRHWTVARAWLCGRVDADPGAGQVEKE